MMILEKLHVTIPMYCFRLILSVGGAAVQSFFFFFFFVGKTIEESVIAMILCKELIDY